MGIGERFEFEKTGRIDRETPLPIFSEVTVGDLLNRLNRMCLEEVEENGMTRECHELARLSRVVEEALERSGLTKPEIGPQRAEPASVARIEAERKQVDSDWPPACRHGVKGPCGECQARIY